MLDNLPTPSVVIMNIWTCLYREIKQNCECHLLFVSVQRRTRHRQLMRCNFNNRFKCKI